MHRAINFTKNTILSRSFTYNIPYSFINQTKHYHVHSPTTYHMVYKSKQTNSKENKYKLITHPPIILRMGLAEIETVTKYNCCSNC